MWRKNRTVSLGKFWQIFYYRLFFSRNSQKSSSENYSKYFTRLCRPIFKKRKTTDSKTLWTRIFSGHWGNELIVVDGVIPSFYPTDPTLKLQTGPKLPREKRIPNHFAVYDFLSLRLHSFKIVHYVIRYDGSRFKATSSLLYEHSTVRLNIELFALPFFAALFPPCSKWCLNNTCP